MSRIPSGTITLLFTDIEGSTRLWEIDPEAMAIALRQHDALLRAAIEGAAGYVFKTVGDAFCAAFEAPKEAVDAAVAAQRAIGAVDWPTSRPIRVRMALHTGQAEERDDDYFGPVVNRVARLEAIAHGGQVLLSGVTATLVSDSLPPGTELVDLGQHRLRDLGRSEHVYQLVVAGLPDSFPQLASLDNPELPNNLPSLLSTFIGREEELKTLTKLLGESRLVTLTGAGGCGKTRLALQAAVEHLDAAPDGVWFADLAPLTDGSQIPAVVAAALGLRDRDELTLLRALRDADTLIVLDNCEHIIDAAAGFSARVMQGCRTARILATSREPLGIDGERVCRVASLSLPAYETGLDDASALASSDAVRLFVDRALSVDPAFALDDRTAPLIASLCRRLDGIPLALELAAARLSSMALPQLVERLDRRFRLLTGGSRNAVPRQQTLQATVDWSFGLLNDAERETIRRLSVFASGFDLEAAEAICAAGGTVDEFEVIDRLHSLVSKSLVVTDHGQDAVRYRLLETIRQYCAEDLLRASGEDAMLRLRTVHADYFLGLALKAGPRTKGPDQGRWLHRLDSEWENIRAAHVELTASGRIDDILRLCVALERFALTRGHADVLTWVRTALDEASVPAGPLLVEALHLRVGLTMVMYGRDVGQLSLLRPLAERELALARELGDPVLEGWAMYDHCLAAWREQDTTAMGRHCEQALAMARQVGDSGLVALVLDYQATFLAPAAERPGIYLEAMEHHRASGDLLSIALCQSQLFSVDLRAGTPDLTQARRHLEEGIAIATDIGADLVVYLLHTAKQMLLLYDGDYQAAASLVRQDLLTIRRIDTEVAGGTLFLAAACCAAWRGLPEIAARLFAVADRDLEAGVADGSFTWTPLERELHDREQNRLTEAMGGEAFAAAYQSGIALSRQEAIDLALGRAR